MNLYLRAYKFICIFLLAVCTGFSAGAHEIIFCGERIPVEDDFVSRRLMNAIRSQIPNVKLAELRKRSNEYFPLVEYYLKKANMPEDLKYIAIVESGFENLTSRKGAQGFWQLMEKTAKQYGLIVRPDYDERNDIKKATVAACKHLAYNYLSIRKTYQVSSWVLTAATYNYGIGNMYKTIKRQGTNYFSMELNPETAAYVYKIIAVKELFERPELYMKDFGFNVFNDATQSAAALLIHQKTDTARFNSMTVLVNENAEKNPVSIEATQLNIKEEDLRNTEAAPEFSENEFTTIRAVIEGKYKTFEEGDLVTIRLTDNLQIGGSFTRRGNVIKGNGWFIDDRIFIGIGSGEDGIILIDANDLKKGIAISSLKNKQAVLLKVRAVKNE